MVRHWWQNLFIIDILCSMTLMLFVKSDLSLLTTCRKGSSFWPGHQYSKQSPNLNLEPVKNALDLACYCHLCTRNEISYLLPKLSLHCKHSYASPVSLVYAAASKQKCRTTNIAEISLRTSTKTSFQNSPMLDLNYFSSLNLQDRAGFHVTNVRECHSPWQKSSGPFANRFKYDFEILYPRGLNSKFSFMYTSQLLLIFHPFPSITPARLFLVCYISMCLHFSYTLNPS